MRSEKEINNMIDAVIDAGDRFHGMSYEKV